jgi:hypothetical protein
MRRSQKSRPTWRPSLVFSELTKLQETLVDAIHRFRASIRTLSGPLLGPVQVGVRFESPGPS